MDHGGSVQDHDGFSWGGSEPSGGVHWACVWCSRVVQYNIALEQARKCSEGIDTDGRDAMTDVDGKKAIYYRAFLKWMMPEYNWDGK